MTWRQFLSVLLVAAGLALYGLSGTPGAQKVPPATPGGSCPSLAAVGAWGDRAYICQTDPEDMVLRWRPL